MNTKNLITLFLLFFSPFLMGMESYSAFGKSFIMSNTSPKNIIMPDEEVTGHISIKPESSIFYMLDPHYNPQNPEQCEVETYIPITVSNLNTAKETLPCAINWNESIIPLSVLEECDENNQIKGFLQIGPDKNTFQSKLATFTQTNTKRCNATLSQEGIEEFSRLGFVHYIPTTLHLNSRELLAKKIEQFEHNPNREVKLLPSQKTWLFNNNPTTSAKKEILISLLVKEKIQGQCLALLSTCYRDQENDFK